MNWEYLTPEENLESGINEIRDAFMEKTKQLESDYQAKAQGLQWKYEERLKRVNDRNNSLITTHNEMFERIGIAVKLLDLVANQRARNLCGRGEDDVFGDADRYHINKAIGILRMEEQKEEEVENG